MTEGYEVAIVIALVGIGVGFSLAVCVDRIIHMQLPFICLSSRAPGYEGSNELLKLCNTTVLRNISNIYIRL